MPATGFPPKSWFSSTTGQFATVIVPAEGGCNLRCPQCFIRQRREIDDTQLAPGDYAAFLRGVARADTLAAVAIQGYEPLLPSALPYTQAILRTSRELGVPASLVTNGTFLAEALPALRDCMPDRIGVSIDAAAAERHDRLRGVSGTWAHATRGMESLLAQPSPGTNLTVISVLLPGKCDDLIAIPSLLQALGVSDWIVNPVITIGRKEGIYPGSVQKSIDALNALADQAEKHSIRLEVGDEFGLFARHAKKANAVGLDRLSFCTLPKGICLSRLMPGGQLSVGECAVRIVGPNSPRWTPGQDVCGFLENPDLRAA